MIRSCIALGVKVELIDGTRLMIGGSPCHPPVWSSAEKMYEMIEYCTLKCQECGHAETYHDDPGSDWIECHYGTYTNERGESCMPCNCGNHIGR